MIESLKQRMKDLNYPGGQTFDVETFEPYGEARKRFDLAKKNMPEVLAGGETFLDIGSSKGMMCFFLRNAYKKLVGYEVAKAPFQFAEDVRKYHNIENIKFMNMGFRDIYVDKGNPFYTRESKMVKNNPRLDKYLDVYTGEFDVVYCGSVHHHFYKDAKLIGANPFLWCKKLIALAKNYIILDGPISPDDGSVKVFEKEGGWDRSDFTLENIIREMIPQFQMVRYEPNERNRHTVVFKRVLPNMEYIRIEAVAKGTEFIRANSARAPDCMYRLGKYRVKMDTGLQSDGVFQILNSMPDLFIPHTAVIVDDYKRRVGDIALWTDGNEVKDKDTLYHHFLKMNNELSCLGLVEPHFKISDYKWWQGLIVDVDVDMIRQAGIISDAYLDHWYKTKTEFMPYKEKSFRKLVDNWTAPDIYRRLLDES